MKETDYPTLRVLLEGRLSNLHSLSIKLVLILCSSCSVRSIFHLRINSEKASNAF